MHIIKDPTWTDLTSKQSLIISYEPASLAQIQVFMQVLLDQSCPQTLEDIELEDNLLVIDETREEGNTHPTLAWGVGQKQLRMWGNGRGAEGMGQMDRRARVDRGGGGARGVGQEQLRPRV